MSRSSLSRSDEFRKSLASLPMDIDQREFERTATESLEQQKQLLESAQQDNAAAIVNQQSKTKLRNHLIVFVGACYKWMQLWWQIIELQKEAIMRRADMEIHISKLKHDMLHVIETMCIKMKAIVDSTKLLPFGDTLVKFGMQASTDLINSTMAKFGMEETYENFIEQIANDPRTAEGVSANFSNEVQQMVTKIYSVANSDLKANLLDHGNREVIANALQKVGTMYNGTLSDDETTKMMMVGWMNYFFENQSYIYSMIFALISAYTLFSSIMALCAMRRYNENVSNTELEQMSQNYNATMSTVEMLRIKAREESWKRQSESKPRPSVSHSPAPVQPKGSRGRTPQRKESLPTEPTEALPTEPSAAPRGNNRIRGRF